MSFGNVPPANTLAGAGGYYAPAAPAALSGAGGGGGGNGDNGAPLTAAGSAVGPLASAAAPASLTAAAPPPGLPPRPPRHAFSVDQPTGGAGGRAATPGRAHRAGAGAGAPAPPSASPSPRLRPRARAPTLGASGHHLRRAKRSAYESLHLEVVENAAYRAEHAAQTHLDQVWRGLAKWSMCFALAVVTAAASVAVNYAVENLAGLKFGAALALLAKGRTGAAFVAYAAANVSLVAAAAALTARVAPEAAGSGIAEVKVCAAACCMLLLLSMVLRCMCVRETGQIRSGALLMPTCPQPTNNATTITIIHPITPPHNHHYNHTKGLPQRHRRAARLPAAHAARQTGGLRRRRRGRPRGRQGGPLCARRRVHRRAAVAGVRAGRGGVGPRPGFVPALVALACCPLVACLLCAPKLLSACNS